MTATVPVSDGSICASCIDGRIDIEHRDAGGEVVLLDVLLGPVTDTAELAAC